MIRKPNRSNLLLPLPVIGIMITVLFLFIYATVFIFANPDNSDVKTDLPQNNSNQFNVINKSQDEDENENRDISESADKEHSDTYTFLAVGKDASSGLTDVIMLASFDTKNLTVNVIQIPRDTYYRCTERIYRKINGATDALGGIDKFAESLESAFGIRIDYTVQFSLDALGKMVDLIDGVPVNIPSEMDYEDPSQNLYIHLDAGEHLLDGETAKQFVRFRSSYIRGDIARTDAQKIFMAAFVNKLTTGVSVLKIPSIINVMLDDVKTNMSFKDCLTFAQKAMSVKTTDVVMVTVPGSDTRTQIDSGAWYYIINRTAALEIINKYLNTDNKPVEDKKFDPERLFTNEHYPQYEEIYYGDGFTIKEYRANEINENGIGISVKDR